MSFNFGAGKKARVKEAFRFQLTLCVGYTTLFWLLMMAVPGVVAGIFTSDAALIDYTTWAMRIYMAGILAMGVQIACQQSFMAVSYTHLCGLPEAGGYRRRSCYGRCRPLICLSAYLLGQAVRACPFFENRERRNPF